MVTSENTTATKLAALRRKQMPTPTVAISTPATAGPIGPGGVDHRRVQAHGVADLVRSDHLEHEGLASGVLEAVVQPEHDSENEDSPVPHGTRDREQSENEGLYAHRRLQHDHEPALVDTICDDASVGTETAEPASVCSATARPRSVAEWVRTYTSHDCATDCIHVPTIEIAWPM